MQLKNKPKVAVISPYFGPLPKMMDLWLQGIKNIETVQFFLITDQALVVDQNNVTVVNMSFLQCSEVIKTKIKLNHKFSPYKLCDFKPSFGYIFMDIIDGYDFWGYCDLDMCFGDLDGYLEKNLYKPQYFRIFDLGHLSIFRQTTKILNLFNEVCGSSSPFNAIKNSETIWVFDENYNDNFGGYNKIFKNEYGCKFFSDRALIFDTHPGFFGFLNAHENDGETCTAFFHHLAGKLFSVTLKNNLIVRKEICYAHFQKRDINWSHTSDGFLITPKHWPEVNDYENAVILLKKMRLIDTATNVAYEKWKKRRRNLKLIRLFIEPLTGRFRLRDTLFIIFKAIFRKFR